MNLLAKDITKDEAEQALRAAAVLTDEDGRTTVHSFLGSIGADHDLDSALAKVRGASRVVWTSHWCHHDLAVLIDGKVYHYDVPRPEHEAAG